MARRIFQLILTDARKDELARLLRPVALPRELDNVYSQDQLRRFAGVVRNSGPHKLIIAQHLASAEELLATSAGGHPEGVTPMFDMLLLAQVITWFSHDPNSGFTYRPEELRAAPCA